MTHTESALAEEEISFFENNVHDAAPNLDGLAKHICAAARRAVRIDQLLPDTPQSVPAEPLFMENPYPCEAGTPLSQGERRAERCADIAKNMREEGMLVAANAIDALIAERDKLASQLAAYKTKGLDTAVRKQKLEELEAERDKLLTVIADLKIADDGEREAEIERLADEVGRYRAEAVEFEEANAKLVERVSEAYERAAKVVETAQCDAPFNVKKVAAAIRALTRTSEGA